MKIPDTLPWKLDRWGHAVEGEYSEPVCVSGFSLNCGGHNQEAVDNTEYIVQACNLYPEMKEILGKLILAIEAEAKYMYMAEIQESKELEEAKELLNKLGEAHIEEVP